MKRLATPIYLILLLFLLSCNTTVNNSYTATITNPQPIFSSKSKDICVNYKMLDLGITPLIPLKELELLTEKDHKKKIAILIDYIEKLRIHVKDVKKITAEEYQTHLEKCHKGD